MEDINLTTETESVEQGTPMKTPVKIRKTVATGASYAQNQLSADLLAVRTGQTTRAMMTLMDLYNGMLELLENQTYRTTQTIVENIREALGQSTPEATVEYLKDWLRLYENHYEVIDE